MNRDTARLADKALTAAIVHSQEQGHAVDEQIDMVQRLAKRAAQAFRENRVADTLTLLGNVATLASGAALRLEAAQAYRRGAESVFRAVSTGEVVKPDGPGIRAILRE